MDGLFAYRILLIFLILALNGFFAGAEVALLSVRQSRLKAMAEEGQIGAQAALSLLANSERLLSVVQVGVTLASLGLGWAGEDTIFRLIMRALNPALTPATEPVLHGVSFALAFLVMTYAHVVLGEVVPKNLAIEKADRLAVIVAPALLVFYRISGPFVFVIERSAATISKVLGLRGTAHGGGHSPEELKFIISNSLKEGHLFEFEQGAMQRLIDLHNFAVREIMVPRKDIVSVPLTSTLDEVLKLMAEHQYSRLPVHDEKPEQIVGIVHAKDLVLVWRERRRANELRRPVPPFDLRRLLRKPIVVPETKLLNQLVDEFRKTHTHMAMVVDEFGTIAGLVTLEDVMEQIFGEIEDEHDIRRPLPPIEAATLELDGGTNIRDLETQYGIEVPVDAGFETLAGFLLFELGRIPAVGDAVEHGNRRFTVLSMERNRIARVLVEKVEPVSIPVDV
jgi:CBS domain containing-hemolysin-like protein